MLFKVGVKHELEKLQNDHENRVELEQRVVEYEKGMIKFFHIILNIR